MVTCRIIVQCHFLSCTFALVVKEDRVVFLHDVGEEESSAHFAV